jgi:hypothetical protein
MEITLQYFDGCPGWETTDAHLASIIAENGLKATVTYQQIETQEGAVEHQFRGSPTVLFDGVDPFANTVIPIGLSCRIYKTDQGNADSPTLDQLKEAIGLALQEA